jgi:hypothetical protein
MRNFYGFHDEAGGGAGAGGGGTGGAGGGGAGGAGSGTLLDGTGSGGAGGAGGGAGGAGGAGSGQGGGTGAGAGTGAPVVTKSFREGWIGADGRINKANYENLPDSLKPWKETFSKYDTDEQLLTAFAHSVSLNGKKGLLPLPANASDADKQAFNARLRELQGVPEKPEGYGVAKPKDLPDDQWNGEYVNSMVGILHKHGVPPAAVKELLEADQKHALTMRGQSDASVLQSLNEGRAAVQQAFGADMDAKLGQARRMALTLGLDVKDPQIANNPKLIIALQKAATLISEDKMVTSGDGGVNTGGNDREKAKDIVHNKANPLHEAYHNPAHGLHAQALQTVTALNANAARLKVA